MIIAVSIVKKAVPVLTKETALSYDPKNKIVYKKTDEWYNEWQLVTTNNNE